MNARSSTPLHNLSFRAQRIALRGSKTAQSETFWFMVRNAPDVYSNDLPFRKEPERACPERSQSDGAASCWGNFKGGTTRPIQQCLSAFALRDGPTGLWCKRGLRNLFKTGHQVTHSLVKILILRSFAERSSDGLSKRPKSKVSLRIQNQKIDS